MQTERNSSTSAVIRFPELSVIVPFLNEEHSIPLLKQRILALTGLPDRWELVFVSDGTTDQSLKMVEDWTRQDERIKLIVLTRNFGHQAAISAGLDYATGNYVGVMDADLQDPPEVLVQMFQLAQKEHWDSVYAVRAQRRGSMFKRFSYKMFYLFYTALADTPVAVDSGDFCVLSRRAANLLSSMPERSRFLRGLRSWTGLRQIGFPIERPERIAGKAQYSLAKLMALAVTGITSFSIKPLRLATLVGIILCFLSITAAFAYLVIFLTTDLYRRVPGFTTIVILILLLNGIQFLMMGILGEYVGRIFWEVKQRPTYLVERTHNFENPVNS